MALTGFGIETGPAIGDASIWAAGEQLVDDGQNTVDEVATAGSNTPNADAGREVPGFSDSFINTVLTNANITDSKAQDILNETDIARDDITGAAAILYRLADDWQDNQFDSNREDRATTPAEELGANEFAQNFRPEWTDTGDATVTATGGQLVVDGGTVNGGNARTASVTYPTGVLGATGDWQCEFSFTNDIDGQGGANNPVLMMPVFNDNDSMLYIRVSTGAPSIDVVRRRGGGQNQIMTTGAVAIGTSVHTVRLTINEDGDLELFYDGVSEDTTDNGQLPRYGFTALGGAGADTDVQYNWLNYAPI